MEKPLTIPTPNKRKRNKSLKTQVKRMRNEVSEDGEESKDVAVQKLNQPKETFEGLSMEEISEKYPILKDEQLVQKFLSVTMTNNQKGRIRQVLKDNLKGTTDSLLPDIIYSRIQLVLKSTENLTDTDLRKLRILYNMLKTAAQTANSKSKIGIKVKSSKEVKEVKKINPTEENKEEKEPVKSDKEKTEQKVKGPKRYVVFIGNLPLTITKEKIREHFADIMDQVTDVRVPKQIEGKKSAIAYLEVKDETSYELALSKHHSMLENKRINVLYSTQQKSKISKEEAKSKSAKLVALRKSGKLLGSIPLNRKRSQRRKKMKAALKKQAAESA